MTKISIIGSGAIGGNIAYNLAHKGCYSIQMIDIDEGIAQGKCLDILHSLAIENKNGSMKASSNFDDIKGSDVVVITAGAMRTPGKSRMDLLKTNGDIIEDIAKKVKQLAKNSFVIMVTNPLDLMAWHFQKHSDLPCEKIVGMAGSLDMGRFRYELSKELEINVLNIQTQVIGPHDDHMIPLISHTFIAGIPLKHFILKGHISEESIGNAIKRAKDSGTRIVELMKNRSAFYAPSNGIYEIVESYVNDQKKVITCSVHASLFGVEQDFFMGMPSIIGCEGLEYICQPELDAFEKEMMDEAVDHLLTLQEGLIKISSQEKRELVGA